MPLTTTLDRLGPEDERILALERGPIVGHVCKVLVVDPPPGGRPLTADSLSRWIARRLPAVPRCIQRIQVLPRGLGRPVWVADPNFDIRNHVRRAAAARTAVAESALPGVVAALMSERLDRTRPLWALDIAPLQGGRTALIWRVHHCMADGFTALRIGARMLWTARDGAVAETPAPQATAPAAPRDLVTAAAADRLAGALRAARRAATAAGDRSRWREAMAGIDQLPGTIRRELAPSMDPSPFDAPAGSRRAVAWTRAPLAKIHDAVKTFDQLATVNDAVVSLVAAGVAEWLRAGGRAMPSVRVRIPVSLHRPDEAAAAGNRDSFIDVEVPLQGSMRERVLEVSRQTSERKRLHDAEHLDRLFREVGLLPLGSHALAMTAGPREFSLCVSNVPGPSDDIYVLGRRVAELYSVVEIAEHHALRVSVLSSGGALSFALCANPDSVDPALVVRGIDGGVVELLGA